MDGTNPKYVIKDAEGVKWTVKLSEESRPETVASRLVWAVGYFAPEEYFLPALQVRGVPAKLHRGRKLVGPDGSMKNARLKRHAKGEKLGEWKWREDPLAATRELNGLRVMMALINNWDLKNVNNAIYEDKKDGRRTYMVSDLGATFGSPGLSRTKSISKGNLRSYEHSQFITKVRAEDVDFKTPARPTFWAIVKPPNYFMRVHLMKLGRHVPREDCRWIGQLLSRLSASQIRDAFRSAGYTAPEVESFSRVVEQRIAALQQL